MDTNKWYGKLEVVCGPMYASKTTRLLKEAYWAKDHMKLPILVLKPSVDDRYSVTEVVSHDGASLPAMCVSAFPEINDGIGKVFIDEVQFFTPNFFKGNLPEEVRKLLSRGIDVMACGLDMDWQGRPFEVMAQLLGMADRIEKVTAVCHVPNCRAPATKNFKLTPNNKQVEVGAGDLYEARCNEHWHCHDHGH